MKFALCYHSLRSDWNHGNAHFLRGFATELIMRGHDVVVYEPQNAWSYINLLREQDGDSLAEYERMYPLLRCNPYEVLDVDRALDGVDVAIVHEWNDHELVSRIGKYRSRCKHLRLLFHDTHHRGVTAPDEIEGYDLEDYDGVLAYGRILRDLYIQNGWAARAWSCTTWPAWWHGIRGRSTGCSTSPRDRRTSR